MSSVRWVNHTHWACSNHVPPMRFPAAAEQCLLGCAVTRPENRPQPVSPPSLMLVPPPEPEPVIAVSPAPVIDPVQPAEDWRKLEQVTDEELMAQSLNDLRKYAAHCLKIAGASKVPGGKRALVQVILGHRQRAA